MLNRQPYVNTKLISMIMSYINGLLSIALATDSIIDSLSISNLNTFMPARLCCVVSCHVLRSVTPRHAKLYRLTLSHAMLCQPCMC